jgi:hypothetical protein
MSYADSLLSTGERITHRVRQHWFVLVWGARIPIAAIIVAIILLFLSRGIGDPAGTLLGLLTAVLFFGGLAFLAWGTLRYLNTEFVLTNRRVVQVEGVVNKRATDSSLEKINDAVLSQSIFGRVFGFGDLDVLTAAEAGIERFRMIIDPIGFKRAMLDAKHEYEVDMERSGWQPSPPIRAAAPSAGPPSGGAAPATGGGSSTGGGSGSGPTPSGVGGTGAESTAAVAEVPPRVTTPAPVSSPTPSAVAAPPKVNPDEVTRTLANLADLRDRGAISAEEYEAKKTDLLGRL